MTDSHPEPTPRQPTSKELRDARREAHAAQKKSSKKNDKKGKMGKGDSKP